MPKKKEAQQSKFSALLAEHKRGAAITVVVVLAAVVLSHVALGKAGTWKKQAASDSQQATSDQLAYQVGEAARLHAASFRHDIAAATVAVPVGEDQPSLVSSLGGLASSCGASWSSSSWSAAPSGATSGPSAANAWSVQVALAGPSAAVQCVLQGLPAMKRAVEVTDVGLSYESGGQVQADVSLNVYGRNG